ncbi:substrate-binding domain-containing protein [soil metagenome]
MSREGLRRLAALLLVLGLMATACGSDDGGGDTTGGDTTDAGDDTTDAGDDATDTGDDTTDAGDDATDTGDGDAAGGEGLIAVLLPDSASSSRWENDDRRFFEQAFEAAGLSSDEYQILNAEGDASQQQAQAEQAITNGATVLLLVNLDSGSGATIIDNAKSEGVAVIDYDRLTLDADADYYVSFDNEAVGRLQGETLVDCVEEQGIENPRVAVLNGSPTDNNATLFKNGYDSVINPLFDSGDWTEVDDQSVPDWDNQQALVIFEQMLTAADDGIDAVLAANDGLGNAAIQALATAGIEGVPVTGQDATAEGIQNIVLGNQCMTVYKAIRAEAEAAADLAIQLRNGETPEFDAATDNGTKEVPSLLLEPVAVTIDNINETVIADEFRSIDEICVGDAASSDWCTENG